MRLRSTDPVVDTRLAVGMGEFVEAVPPAERPVQFSFTDTPIREAAGNCRDSRACAYRWRLNAPDAQ